LEYHFAIILISSKFLQNFVNSIPPNFHRAMIAQNTSLPSIQ